MEEARFLRAQDVAKRMDISVPTAYKIIRQLNDQLESKGYLIVHGRVSRAYFEEMVYDVSGGKEAL